MKRLFLTILLLAVAWPLFSDPTSPKQTKQPEKPELITCPRCEGARRVDNYSGRTVRQETCPECRGRGKTERLLTGAFGYRLGEKFAAKQVTPGGGNRLRVVLEQPRQPYRQFTDYELRLSPQSRRILVISAAYPAPDEPTARHECDLIVAQLREKYQGKLRAHQRISQNILTCGESPSARL